MFKEKNNFLPILIIAGVFFIFGFVTWINGALIPFMKTINELTDAQSYLVASASYISFVVMALPASYILNKIGYKNLIALISRAYTQGQSTRGVFVQREWIEEFNEGLIALSGACEGDIGQALLGSNPQLAGAAAKKWQQVFGNRFYIDLQRLGRADDERYIHASVALAEQLSIPVVGFKMKLLVASICLLALYPFAQFTWGKGGGRNPAPVGLGEPGLAPLFP